MTTLEEQRSIPPDPSRTLQVIGAGMSRTGTVSFTLALSQLLHGPVCHTGSASLAREESWIKKWIAVLGAQSGRDDAYIRTSLRDILAGYVGVTDALGAMFTKELLEVFPDAKVVVTTRDPRRWWESMSEMMETVNKMWILRIIFLPMPTLRYFGRWVTAMDEKTKQLHGPNAKLCPEYYNVHIAYLKRIVPPERLFFFDVKEGWGPLCKILDCPIPDEPFPHANDKLAVRETLEGLMKAAVVRWIGIFAVVGLGIAIALYAQR